ncbi:MAG TPA: hypothetical protein VFH48_18345 [Chloroflexota bacterium]|nr:hypothetical protein [Chloroflexota bacterium]
MSKDGVEAVLTRAAQDEAFKRQVMDDPSVLDQYDLTDAEKSALVSKDHASLEAVGVDQRKTSWMARKDTGPQ